MNLYNLKYFVDSARLGSMTKAADLHKLSRPAISQAIRKLEDEMGVTLLVHKRRSFELTQLGMLLWKKSESLLAQVETIRNDLRGAKGPITGEFKIGSSRSLADFNLPPILTRLRKEFTEVDFKIEFANSKTLVQKMQKRELDLIFFIGDETLTECKQIIVNRGYYSLIKPKHLKFNETQFAITEQRPETERLRILFERTFLKELPVFAEIQSWNAIRAWINLGICGGLIPDFMLQEVPEDKKANYITVLPKIFPYEIKIMFAKTKAECPVVKSFIQL